MKRTHLLLVVLMVGVLTRPCYAKEREISREQLLDKLVNHAAAKLVQPAADPTKVALPRLLRGWDQASSEIIIRRSGQEISLFYQSPSRDGRPQTGMSDDQWRELRQPLDKLMQQARDDGAKTTIEKLRVIK